MQVARFGRIAEELGGLGARLFGVSRDSPAAHGAWARELGDLLGGQELLSDWNGEAARAFGVHRDEVMGFRPLNVRGAFLVDAERVCRYAWAGEQPGELPDPEPALAAARAL